MPRDLAIGDFVTIKHDAFGSPLIAVVNSISINKGFIDAQSTVTLELVSIEKSLGGHRTSLTIVCRPDQIKGIVVDDNSPELKFHGNGRDFEFNPYGHEPEFTYWWRNYRE